MQAVFDISGTSSAGITSATPALGAAHNVFITRGTNRTAGDEIGELLKGKLAFYIT